MQRRRIVVAAAMVTAAGAAVAFTLPSMAGTTPSGKATAQSSQATASGRISPQLVAAMQRDLGISADEVTARIKRQAWASGVTAELRSGAGDAWAGSWLGKDGATLNVAVTDADLAAKISAAGAQPKLVKFNAQQLSTVKSRLDAAATRADRALPGWFVDVAGNKVVMLANPGDVDQARELAANAGLDADTVTVKTTKSKPRTLADVRGADPYFIAVGGGQARCSIGFAVEGGFVTAGHCGEAGTATTDVNQQEQGVVKASVFPGNADFGVVETNADATLRAVINDFQGDELPVAGSDEAPVGSAVCRSGSTTGTHCGVILAKNETVNYPEGAVTGLTRTTACAEGGDSGGPWFSGDQAQGVTSGGSGDCTVGGETFFQPLNEILDRNNATLLTTDNAGGNQGGGNQGGGNQGGAANQGGNQGAGNQGGGNQGGAGNGGVRTASSTHR